MGIDVLQSQKLEILLQALLQDISQPAQHAAEVLQPKWLIVPNHGIEQWLKQSIAQQLGISANLKFSGLRTAQWQLFQQQLGADAVAQVPQLLNMKWRIFLFLMPYLQQSLSPDHPLYPLLNRVQQHSAHLDQSTAGQIKQQSLVYWIADQCSRLFSNYLIYRGECVRGCPSICSCRQNWLAHWGQGQALPLQALLQHNDQQSMTQASAHYALQQAEQMEAWQRFIWQHAFAEDYAQIQALSTQFWQTLAANPTQHSLPKVLYIFTLLELPPAQLLFLRRLAQYIQIKIYHYSPSQEYWADSVDPKWKAKFALQRPHAAVYYESRHPLLTRLGKQARDHSALLSQLAGGEEGLWQDIFVEPQRVSLLTQLQADILELVEPQAGQYRLEDADQSLQIHVCHSSYRQLEVLKDQLLHWLNQADTPARQADDILILLPNLAESEAQIRTVFASQPYQSSTYLPIKIAGVAPLDAIQLWHGLSLRISLLQQRFSFEQFMDWLHLAAIQSLYALNFEQLERIRALLQQAGFKRGFDTAHLRLSLHPDDQDYRFSFSYALQRLALSVAMPAHALYQGVLGIAAVQRSDFELIETLLKIYQDLDQRRTWLDPKGIAQQATVQASLACLEEEIQSFSQIAGFVQVEQALQQLKRIIHVMDSEQLPLPLQYLLDEIANTIRHQLAQSEPTGQITFAQIGQLRPLPYRLIVCLNLDSGSFPNRDSQIPFDLIDVFKSELGDRSRLEDDQGAFLDALLQAREAFWVFYNGFDVADHQPRDPSSVLQELLSHLDFIVHKPDEMATQTQIDGLVIASQLQSLYHVHALQPFDPQGFVTQPWQPPRFKDQWSQVAQQIVQPQDRVWHWLDQSTLPTEPLAWIDGSQWIRDLCHPAKHYLRSVGVRSISQIEPLQNFEPLQLDGLQNYVLRDDLQQQMQQPKAAQDQAVAMDLFQDQLPIGKMQGATWQQAVQQLDLVLQRLADYGGQLTSLTKRAWALDSQTQFLLSLPNDEAETQWLSLTASSCRNERALVIWLEYLCWRAWHPSSAATLQRIALFSNLTLEIQGLTQQQALEQLRLWQQVWQVAQQQPLILVPAIFAELGPDKVQWDFEPNGDAYCKNYQKILDRWLGKKFYSNPAQFDASNDQGCYLSPEWSLLLASAQQAERQFDQALQHYAAQLYLPMHNTIRVIEVKP